MAKGIDGESKRPSRRRKRPARGSRTPSLDTFNSRDEVNKERATRWAELYSQKRHAEDVLERHWNELSQHPDVTGVHVGFHRQHDKIVRPLKYCIRVHVANKRQEDHPELLLRLDDHLEDVEVDVLEGRYKTLLGSWDEKTVEGGLPIAPAGLPNEFGTLGGVVFANGIARYITNQHVAGGVGNEIQLLGKLKGTDIGKVVAAVSRVDGDNDLDVALIAPKTPPAFGFDLVAPGSMQLVGSNALFAPGILTDADKNRTLCFKIGAQTGDPGLKGVVQDVNTRIRIGPDGTAGTWMTGQIIIAPQQAGDALIKEGDSGSLLIAPISKNGIETYMVVGLVHAMRTTDNAIVACHFNRISDRLIVTLF